MILIIDNYDSFTYNLVQLVEELGEQCQVVRNDQINIEEIKDLNPDYIIISPGPGIPERAGITMKLIKSLGEKIPILGVCLGHQAIAKVFGGDIKLSKELFHGKSSKIIHENTSIFKNIPNFFEAGRYHSYEVDSNHLPTVLNITAKTVEGDIMAIKHTSYPIEGVQFHPESILTEHGKEIILNFINYYSKYKPSQLLG